MVDKRSVVFEIFRNIASATQLKLNQFPKLICSPLTEQLFNISLYQFETPLKALRATLSVIISNKSLQFRQHKHFAMY